MARNAKKVQAAGTPITRYFTRKQTQSSSVNSDTPMQTSPHPSPSSERLNCESPSTSSHASSKKRKAVGLSDLDVDNSESSQRVNRSTSTRAAPLTPLSPRENLLHHPTSVRFRNLKKQRLSLPDAVAGDEIVPGSESDEVEIPARKTSSAQVNTALDEPTETEQDFEDEDVVSMDIDNHSPLFTPQSTSYSLFGTEPDTPYSFGSPSMQPLTPPSSSPAPERMASTLDSEAKTRQLIEEIRAKARAKVMSSPEPIAELPSPSDSGEDDDFPDLPVLVGSNKGKEKAKEIPELPFSKSNPTVAGSSKYNLRQLARKPVTKEVVPFKEFKRSKIKPINPLLALLKEKSKADSAGKGTDAFTSAEHAVAGKRELRDEMDGEEDADDEMEDWMGDEKMAWQAIQEQVDRYGSEDDRGGYNVDIDLDENDAERLFSQDAERGKAVAAILASDKKTREFDHRLVKRVGHPLWVAKVEDAMDVDSRSDFKNADRTPILQSFKAALQEQDTSFACLLLQSGAMNRIDLAVNVDVMSCICDLALTPRHTGLMQAAFYFVRTCWSDTSPSKPFFPFQSMVNIMARLGANVGTFGWMSSVLPIQVTKDERENSLMRLIQLCTLAGSSGKIQSGDAPEVLVALCAISLDPATSSELRTDILVAAHAICSSLVVGPIVANDLESKICSRSLKFISTLTPINRAHAVSIFSAGDGRTLRIARWLSHCLLLERTTVSESEYCNLPQLEPLLLCLAPSGSTSNLFKIHPETDYGDLGFHTEILSTALSDIPRYVAEELLAAAQAKAARLESQVSPSKIEKPTPPIQRAMNCVELLHSNIIDTRGAHLDRSRTKAILKNLSMRLYYQRSAALKSGGAKPKNIKQYFSKRA
ncbi:hypothetical protein E1B28_000572 [Marasmius oreades]|uniref:Uncharacterized protein n=1 Tax=Marasmius oreades TaxID=181124 RepID=A0A9P7V1P9_9AGAR|nr:uncharacterized protein E1B28_000572 [Marasmius oreades]KAG7098656.1 hypothetical protein E1B28_000572 [Marasmius oreades]